MRSIYFLADVYHDQKILKAGVIPADRILGNTQYRREMAGMDVPGGIYAHIAGVDIVRAGAGEYFVLEDNLRVPSGVSYMLENRKMMMRLFPELFATRSIRPIQHYPDMLLENLRGVGPKAEDNPTVAVLTPGAYNSAYFEHAFLAQQMGVELVEGQDLFVQNDTVFMRTTRGPRRIHVMYRRVDDDFLDPLAFRKDSMLGVPGLFAAYRAGRITLANAIGTGVADDKSIYPYVPDMIKFYLGEDPVLNNVPTYMLYKPADRDYALAHLEELVIKEVHGAGGYGMLVGPASTAEEREAFRARILATPERYIAQPTLALSTCPTFVGAGRRAAAHRPAALRAVRDRHRPRAGRTDARRVARRVARRQFVAGRRHQRHVGSGHEPGRIRAARRTVRTRPAHALPAPPTSCTGWRATSSAPRTPRACSTSRTGRRSCRTKPQEPGLAWAEPWAVPLISTGGATTFYKNYPALTAENVRQVHDPRCRQSVVDLLLPARRARVGAQRPRRHHVGDVRGPERRVDRDAQLRLQRLQASACRSSSTG